MKVRARIPGGHGARAVTRFVKLQVTRGKIQRARSIRQAETV